MTRAHRPREIHLEVDLTLERQTRGRYIEVSFHLDPGAASFEVQVSLDGAGADAAVVDLGCVGPQGWRGWSGGARSRFMIGEQTATPGYSAGPLEPGRWAVVLGIHAVPVGSVRAVVRVLSPAGHTPEHGEPVAPEPPGPRGSDRSLPAPEGMRWLAGDMHSHSLHSDGNCGLDEVAREGVRSGLDFLVVTDHNTVSHHQHLEDAGSRQGILLLPGQEVTSHRGHANAFGPIGAVDFREDIDEWAHDVEAAGGLLSVNHPVSGDCAWLETVPAQVSGVEIIHADLYAAPASTAAFAWLALVDRSRELAGQRPLTLLGGSDFHSLDTPIRPGTPTTWVCVEEASPAGVLDALRAGRTTVTSSASLVDGALRPDLLSSPILLRRDEDSLVVLNAEGMVLVDRAGRRRFIPSRELTATASLADGPYRVETAERATAAICR
ncbi:CehA/McbA family metallohydrolase [Brachybacterium sp. p3-SID957]|uniref:CehA/McbA family metallohydrolase n=1 Tax=Brachybacterium sp. p3-SID957 TaxID=2916049 RepID=UPI00223AE57E|nr:CehA/McbA family metallohydrolase [Brachybacterium sp. p3-SID957]MCT1776741.1 CehA/McbA family metallohydrolase [Brachybacterium sp. p3-SID957]